MLQKFCDPPNYALSKNNWQKLFKVCNLSAIGGSQELKTLVIPTKGQF